MISKSCLSAVLMFACSAPARTPDSISAEPDRVPATPRAGYVLVVLSDLLADEARRGLDLAADMANDGDRDTEIKVVYSSYANQLDTEQLGLLQSADVLAIVGGSDRQSTEELSAVASESGIPVISLSVTNFRTDDPRVFQLTPADRYFGIAAAEFCASQGWKDVGVATVVAAGSRASFPGAFFATLRGNGGRRAFKVLLQQGAAPFATAAATANGARVDALLLPGGASFELDFARSLRSLGNKTPLIGAPDWDVAALPSAGVDDVYVPVAFASDSHSGSAFRARFVSAYGREPTDLAATAFDAVTLVAHVADAGKGRIAGALAALDGAFGLARGAMHFDSHRGAVLDVVPVVLVRQGEARVVSEVTPP